MTLSKKGFSMPDQEAQEPHERPDLRWEDIVDNVTTVEKATGCRCKVRYMALAQEGLFSQ
jgi:hypothetical protein